MCFSRSCLYYVRCPDAVCDALVEVVPGILKYCCDFDCTGRVVRRTLVHDDTRCDHGFDLLPLAVEEIICYAEEMCKLHDGDDGLREQDCDEVEEEEGWSETAHAVDESFGEDGIDYRDNEGQGRIIRELTATEEETYEAFEESGELGAAQDWLMELR